MISRIPCLIYMNASWISNSLPNGRTISEVVHIPCRSPTRLRMWLERGLREAFDEANQRVPRRTGPRLWPCCRAKDIRPIANRLKIPEPFNPPGSSLVAPRSLPCDSRWSSTLGQSFQFGPRRPPASESGDLGLLGIVNLQLQPLRDRGTALVSVIISESNDILLVPQHSIRPNHPCKSIRLRILFCEGTHNASPMLGMSINGRAQPEASRTSRHHELLRYCEFQLESLQCQ